MTITTLYNCKQLSFIRGVILSIIVSLFFIPAHAQESDAQNITAESTEFTPLTPTEIETLFQHPRLQGADPATYKAKDLVGIKQFLDESDAFFSTLTPQTGEIKLAKAGATLNMGEDFYFLGSKDARKIIEQHWNNPEDDTVLGMIFAKGTNQDFYNYAVEVKFEKTGYVNDKDAVNIDYDNLLNDLKKSARKSNSQREKLGYPAITVQGWAADPKYDSEMHRLHWAKLLKFDGQDSNTLNYNLRVLGRKGVLQFNFIAEETGLDAVNADLTKVAQIAQFDEGHRYSDFNATTDKVAEYGVAGLIVGGLAAKKLGLIGILLLFLKKGWFLIIAALAFIGKLFKKKSNTV